MILPIAILCSAASAPDAAPTAAGPGPLPSAHAPVAEAPPAGGVEQEEPPGPGEPAKWSGSVNLGASYSDGNTEARTINFAADAERRSFEDRWTAKAYWNYGETRDEDEGDWDLTQRRAGASLKYDYFLSEKLYVFGIAGAETDTLADIRSRYYVGPGVGYQWREDEKLKWGSELGLTYFKTDYRTGDDREHIAARLANNIAWKINDNVSLENSLEAFPSLEDGDDFYGKSDTKIKAALTESMFAQLQWVYQFTNLPAPGKEREDNLIVLGVGWSF